MNRLLDEPRYTRWTWVIAIVLALLLLLLGVLGRGPGAAAPCCSIPAIQAPSAVLPATSAAPATDTAAATPASESAT
jgi:hypothetical protein